MSRALSVDCAIVQLCERVVTAIADEMLPPGGVSCWRQGVEHDPLASFDAPAGHVVGAKAQAIDDWST